MLLQLEWTTELLLGFGEVEALMDVFGLTVELVLLEEKKSKRPCQLLITHLLTYLTSISLSPAVLGLATVIDMSNAYIPNL